MDLLPPNPTLPVVSFHTLPQATLLAELPSAISSPSYATTGFGISEHPKPLILPQWQTFKPGTHNAITDVPGVNVGQVTYKQNTPAIIRTGVTAIVPDAEILSHGRGNLATIGFKAAVVCLSGNGELTGSSFINEFGVLNGPILLTNTRSVGNIHEGVMRYFQEIFPGQWSCQLPVVGECWDGFFNAMEKFVIPPNAVSQAIQQAKPGPVLQGRAGAGTGMRSFELHGGIGSASRKLTIGGREYTIGVLVNTNHSRLKDMNPLIRQQLESRFGPLEALRAKDSLVMANPPQAHSSVGWQKSELNAPISPRQGSIQVVIATDLPLSHQQLEELGRRAALGIGHTGSVMSTTSGDFVTAFSTANPVPMGKQTPTVLNLTEIHPDEMTPAFRATIEAVIVAQLNALVASHS